MWCIGWVVYCCGFGFVDCGEIVVNFVIYWSGVCFRFFLNIVIKVVVELYFSVWVIFCIVLFFINFWSVIISCNCWCYWWKFNFVFFIISWVRLCLFIVKKLVYCFNVFYLIGFFVIIFIIVWILGWEEMGRCSCCCGCWGSLLNRIWINLWVIGLVCWVVVLFVRVKINFWYKGDIFNV